MSYSSTQFRYNSDGLRVQKGNTYYYWTGDKLSMEIRNGECIYFAYNVSGIAGFRKGASYYYFRKNVFGDIIEIMNSSGASVAKYEYDAWGRVTTLNPDGTTNNSSSFIGNINPIRYRGCSTSADIIQLAPTSYFFGKKSKLLFLHN